MASDAAVLTVEQFRNAVAVLRTRLGGDVDSSKVQALIRQDADETLAFRRRNVPALLALARVHLIWKKFTQNTSGHLMTLGDTDDQ